MAITTCPECKREVSSLAASCPHCGCPFQARPSETTPHTTIERTAKPFKAGCLIGLFLFVGGFLSCSYGIATAEDNQGSLPGALGVLAVLAGTLTMVVSQVAAWWHHG